MKYDGNANAEELQEIAAGSIGGALTMVGTPPTEPSFNVMIVNATNDILAFGWYQGNDGLVSRLALPAGAGVTLDFQTNKKGADGDMNFPARRAIYVRQEGTSGSGKVYVTYFYGGK